jgi:hypothetical protein
VTADFYDRFEPIALQPTDWYTGLDEKEAPIAFIEDNGYSIVLTLQEVKSKKQVQVKMNHHETAQLMGALGTVVEFQRQRLNKTLDAAQQFKRTGGT